MILKVCPSCQKGLVEVKKVFTKRWNVKSSFPRKEYDSTDNEQYKIHRLYCKHCKKTWGCKVHIDRGRLEAIEDSNKYAYVEKDNCLIFDDTDIRRHLKKDGSAKKDMQLNSALNGKDMNEPARAECYSCGKEFSVPKSVVPKYVKPGNQFAVQCPACGGKTAMLLVAYRLPKG